MTLVEDEDGARVADYCGEDVFLEGSAAVALAKANVRLGSLKLGRLTRYTEKLQAAMRRVSTDPGGALASVISLENRVKGLPPLFGDSHRFATRGLALAASEWELAYSLSSEISEAYPSLPWPWYVRGASALQLDRLVEARVALTEYQRFVGPDATARELTSDAFEKEGEIAKALNEWRSALEDDRDSLDALYSIGLHLSGEDLAELVTLYRARAHDADLETLFDAWSNNGSCDAVRTLSAVCREEAEPDANAWYYEALCAIWDGDHETAAQLAREGHELAPQDELGVYESLWIEAALELQPTLEVYRGSRDPKLAFDLACQHVLADPVEPANLELLDELVAARAEDDAKDPWLPYYRAELHRERGEFEAAEEDFELGLQRALEEGLEGRIRDYRYARSWSSFEAGAGWQAYSAMPVDEVWIWVRDWMLEAEDGDGLMALIRVRRTEARDDPQLNYYTAKAFLLRDELENGLAILLEGHEAWRLDEKLLPMVEYDLVNTLVDLERYDEALAFAKRSTAGDGDPYYELVVHLAAEQITEVERVFAELVEFGYTPQVLYEGLEDGDQLRSRDEYAPLRERFPPPGPPGIEDPAAD